MNRRSFLQSCLAAATAPYVVTVAGVLMPVRKLLAPDLTEAALEDMIVELARQTDGRGIAINPRWAHVLRPGLNRVFEEQYASIGEALKTSPSGIIVHP